MSDALFIIIPSIIIMVWTFLSFKTTESPNESLLFVNELFSGFISTKIRITVLCIIFVMSLKMIVDIIISKRQRMEMMKEYIQNIAYIIIFLIGSAALGYAISILIRGIEADSVIKATKTLIGLENMILPQNALFLLHSMHIPLFFEILISWSYIHLALMFVMTFILVFIYNPSDFRNLILTITITPLLFFPFWILFPATSPEGFYVENIFDQTFSESETKEILKLERSDYTEKITKDLNEIWISEDNSYLNVSSFPSLHAGWGIILAFFAIRVRRKLGIIYIPWLILNIIGTFYLFQHFILDAIAGVLFSAVILWFFVRDEEY